MVVAYAGSRLLYILCRAPPINAYRRHVLESRRYSTWTWAWTWAWARSQPCRGCCGRGAAAAVGASSPTIGALTTSVSGAVCSSIQSQCATGRRGHAGGWWRRRSAALSPRVCRRAARGCMIRLGTAIRPNFPLYTHEASTLCPRTKLMMQWVRMLRFRPADFIGTLVWSRRRRCKGAECHSWCRHPELTAIDTRPS